MNRKPFYRKVAYYAAIAVLLLPLSWLGQPPAGVEGKGGKLAELRQEYNLSQAQLGEIDPASETMRLATLGMNGVAANVLWHKAIDYHKKKDWSNFMASVSQIIKLQPNFIKVWEFQAHNVSYNTSVEFDDYKYRYAWVKRGIQFLIDGARYNRDEPRLLSNTGHFFGQKLGRADEAKQFRRIFAKDRDFHAEFAHLVNIDDAIGQSGFPDNWLVSRLWYLRAQNVVDTNPDRPLRGESPLLFHSHPPKSRINYAIFNEKDGYHGERARRDWERALREWAEEYGSRQVPTSFGHTLRLNERENVLADVERLKQELETLSGVTFEQIVQEKRATLKPEAREALDTPEAERNTQQHTWAYESMQKILVAPSEVAERAPSAQQPEAERLASAIADLQLLADRIDRYRNIVNYDYWKTRCEVEMTELADQARQLVHDADRLRDAAQLVATSDGTPGAKEQYEAAWKAWAELFAKYPDLKDDLIAEELVEPIRRYEDVLNQLDERLPEDFVLGEILAKHDEAYNAIRQAARAAPRKKQASADAVAQPDETAPPTTPEPTSPDASPNPAPEAKAPAPDEPRPSPPQVPDDEPEPSPPQAPADEDAPETPTTPAKEPSDTDAS